MWLVEEGLVAGIWNTGIEVVARYFLAENVQQYSIAVEKQVHPWFLLWKNSAFVFLT